MWDHHTCEVVTLIGELNALQLGNGREVLMLICDRYNNMKMNMRIIKCSDDETDCERHSVHLLPRIDHQYMGSLVTKIDQGLSVHILPQHEAPQWPRHIT